MEEIFLKVVNMSIIAGYCVLIICVLRLFLRKLPKLYSYVLWSVVYFRLLCPVSIESVFSLIRVKQQTIPVNIIEEGTSQILDEIRPVEIVEETGKLAYVGQAQVAPAENAMQFVLFVMGILWLLVAFGLILHGILSARRLKRKLCNATLLEEGVYQAEQLQTAFVLGVIKPRIYLSAGLVGREREIVLAHEKTHIRRRDYLVKQVAFLISCVHWFNPLVWLAFYLMCRDMEMSCDESVIRSMGKEIKKEYSTSLLALATGRQITNGSLLAFGESGIKKKIKNVLSYKKPTFWMSILFFALLGGVMLGLALNPIEAAETIGESPEVKEQIIGETETAVEAEESETAECTDEAPVTPVLHFYVPQDARDGMYVDEGLLTLSERQQLAEQALWELYNLTGTQIEECYYYYTVTGDFCFGMSEDDMERQRFFLSRAFDGDDCVTFDGYIATMQVSNARRTWYSPVQQYELPEEFGEFSDSGKAVWFLTRSGMYQGGTVVDCIRPYSGMPETWRILMEEGTCYEVTLDKEIDSFADIAGPYPEWEINR